MKIAAGQADVQLPEGETQAEIEIRINAPDFDVLNESGQTVMFMADFRASTEAKFLLRPRDRFLDSYFTYIQAIFKQDGIQIGTAWRTVQVLRNQSIGKVVVTEFPPSPPGAVLDEGRRVQSPAKRSRTRSPRVGEKPVDLSIHIHTDRDGYTLNWIMEAPYIPYPQKNSAEFSTSIPKQGLFVNEYLAPFAKKARSEDKKMTESDIQNLFGLLLNFGRVMQGDFFDFYERALNDFRKREGDQNDHQFSILIYTDNPHLPWELLPLSQEIEQGHRFPPLLGSEHRIGRWIIGAESPRPEVDLTLKGMTVFAPEYNAKKLKLPAAQDEKRFLTDLENGLNPYPIPNEPDLFKRFMQVGETPQGAVGTGILHFVGHGESGKVLDKIAWLRLSDFGDDDYTVLMAETDLGNKLGKLGNEATFAFFNACHAGIAEEEVLGSIGGWAVALLYQNYKGYIGPLWKVVDTEAQQIAETFYTEVLIDSEPVPVGEAMATGASTVC